jgi:hypothetical protein
VPDQKPTQILQEAELGALLASTVKAVLEAQRQMDEFAREQADIWTHTPAGDIALPPLSYVFRNVSIELEMSAAVGAAVEHAGASPRLLCRLLNPYSVGLFGYQAAAGMKVRLVVGPSGVAQVKSEAGNQPPGA